MNFILNSTVEEISQQIDSAQHSIISHSLQIKDVESQLENTLQQIDQKQQELIQHEKRQSHHRKHKTPKFIEVQEGLEICQNTLDTIEQEYQDNHKNIIFEQALNQQLQSTHQQLLKVNESNQQTINQLTQQTIQNSKKLIRQLQIITDIRSMITNTKVPSLSINNDENKLLQQQLQRIESTKIVGFQKQDHEILNSIQQIIHLREECNQMMIPALNLEQTDELVTCDRTFSTPRFQGSMRIKAVDVLPSNRIRTEADDIPDYQCDKRIATDCGFYDEQEELNIQKGHSRKSLKFERALKKKMSYISVASFSSSKQLNLQEELNYLEDLNEYYCTKKMIDDNLIAPCQTPLEQSIEIAKPQEKKKKSIWGMMAIGLGIAAIGYKLYRL